YPADVKCLGFLYLYVGRYPRNNASRNKLSTRAIAEFDAEMRFCAMAAKGSVATGLDILERLDRAFES
ncbi:MAG: hypothetical protein BECKG1743E_GA0114224_103741, partial [Candidatus Kentron sp. G]